MRTATELTAADVLNAIPSAAVVLDGAGRISTVNDLWLRLCATNDATGVAFLPGADYLRVCVDDAAEVADGVRAVIEGRSGRYGFEYSCHSPSEQRWFRLLATPLGEGALLVHQDITDDYTRIGQWLSDTTVAVLELGPDLFPTFVNASWARLMPGEDWMAPLGAVDAAGLRDRLRESVRTAEAFSLDVRVGAGWYRFAIQPELAADGVVHRVVLVGFDVTAERRAVARSAAEHERARLAAELHDTVVQRLYATALALQRRTDTGYVSSDALEEAISRLDRSIGDLRSVGSTRRADTAPLAEALGDALDDAAAALGFVPDVRIDAVDPFTGHHLIAVVTETLSNVARHAQARSCRVELRTGVEVLTLTVTDDGRGMPAALGRSSGTRNISRRAEDVGGTATWRPATPQGTVVTWQVPLVQVPRQAVGS